jgi:hypothetical protein
MGNIFNCSKPLYPQPRLRRSAYKNAHICSESLTNIETATIIRQYEHVKQVKNIEDVDKVVSIIKNTNWEDTPISDVKHPNDESIPIAKAIPYCVEPSAPVMSYYVEPSAPPLYIA